MVEMSDIKKDLERQIKDFRRDMDAQFKEVDHRFEVVSKEFELVRMDISHLDEKIDSHFASLRELLEPLRSIPERVARLEALSEPRPQARVH